MKKIHFCFTIAILGITSLNAQDIGFGFKGGLNLTFINVSEANFGKNSETETGFFGGIYLDVDLVENLHIQPELLYVSLNDFKFINAPIYLKYSVNEKLNLLVGPSMNYFFDFFNNKFKVRADLGLDYSLIEQLNVNVKYLIGFDEITPNGLFLGLGYRL